MKTSLTEKSTARKERNTTFTTDHRKHKQPIGIKKDPPTIAERGETRGRHEAKPTKNQAIASAGKDGEVSRQTVQAEHKQMTNSWKMLLVNSEKVDNHKVSRGSI